MTSLSLRADCARCAALCCIAFAFDQSDLFGADKPAGEPCAHLTACGRCAINPSRVERGYRGCVGYDCLGAGQRVTGALFGGRSWLEDSTLIGPMAAAFFVVRRAHEMLVLLREAERLPLSRPERRRLASLQAALEAAGGEGAVVATLGHEARRFLQGLRRYLTQRTVNGIE